MSQCKSITSEDTQCQRQALPRRRYCWQHETRFVKLTLAGVIAAILAIIGLAADLTGLGIINPISTESVTLSTQESTMSTSPEASPTGKSDTTPVASLQQSVQIRAVGVGGVDESYHSNESIRQQAAYRAAESDAMRRLTEWLGGAEVTGLTIINRGTIMTDTIKIILLNEKVPSHKTIQQSYDAETNTATVILEQIVSPDMNP